MGSNRKVCDLLALCSLHGLSGVCGVVWSSPDTRTLSVGSGMVGVLVAMEKQRTHTWLQLAGVESTHFPIQHAHQTMPHNTTLYHRQTCVYTSQRKHSHVELTASVPFVL